ncbi:response regulator transcription factor [Spirosoma sp.]|uniref:response regulator transcription factor n=1 Tax=Spirosoma sp. TaxID=1899569 RepID=UPI003B3AC982
MSVIKPVLQSPELIAYFLGANNYCWLYFRNGEKKLLAKPISFLEKKLPGFVRVHKTVLINPAYVKSLQQPPRQKMAGEIQLINGEVFPVSRRRWSQVAESLQFNQAKASSEGDEHTVATYSKETTQQADSQTLFLVTADEQNGLIAKRTIERKWPEYQVHLFQQSSHLPDVLNQLPSDTHPTLVILDARTLTLERLHTLQRLKQSPQLNSLPVILLVTPSDQSVIDGYNYRSNSVISMPEVCVTFTQTLERVCRFWLRTVALPGLGLREVGAH